MTVAEVLADARDRMGKAVEAVKEDFGSVRTGRANPALFQKVMVEYYGSPTPLGQLASMNNPEARTLIVTPYDKTALKEIEKALVNVPNLSATVGNDGEMVRLTLPSSRRTAARNSSRSSAGRRRRVASASATSAAAPRTSWTRSRARSATTRSRAVRRSSSPSPRRTPTRSTTR